MGTSIRCIQPNYECLRRKMIDRQWARRKQPRSEVKVIKILMTSLADISFDIKLSVKEMY